MRSVVGMINIAICDGSRYYADELKNYIYAILGDNVFVSVHDNYFSLTTYYNGLIN